MSVNMLDALQLKRTYSWSKDRDRELHEKGLWTKSFVGWEGGFPGCRECWACDL